MCHIIDNLTLYFEFDLIFFYKFVESYKNAKESPLCKGGQYNSSSRKAGID